jgi:hypothetical protein
MSVTTIKDRDNDNQNKVDSTGHVYVTDGGTPIAVTGNITANNASVGTTGSTAPTSATEIGGIDPSGNLQPLEVDSSGNLKVTGSLTIGEGFSTISPGYPTQIPVGTVSTQLFAANPNRKYAHVFNNSAELIFLQYQVSAALNQGIKIQPGSFFTLNSDNLWLGVINAIGLISGQLIDCLEGE